MRNPDAGNFSGFSLTPLWTILRSEGDDLAREAERFADPEVFRALVDLAMRERLAPALHERVEAIARPTWSRLQRVRLATAYEANCRRNRALRATIVALGAAADRRGFCLAPLKGANWFFSGTDPIASWRTMLDADVLVDPERIEDFRAILRELGLEPIADGGARRTRSFRGHFHLPPHVDRRTGALVEAHRHVGFQPFRLPNALMFAGEAAAEPGIVTPSPWCATFHLILHWQIQHNGLARMTCPARDVYELFRRIRDAEVDWERLAAHARKVNAMHACIASLALAHELFDVDVPRGFAISRAAQSRVRLCLELQDDESRRWVFAQFGRCTAYWRADRAKYSLAPLALPKPLAAACLWFFRLLVLPAIAWRATRALVGMAVLRLYRPAFVRWFSDDSTDRAPSAVFRRRPII